MKRYLWIITIFLTVAICQAQWAIDPTQTLHVSSFGLLQQVTSDGDGGIIMVIDIDTSYIQRVDKFGHTMWNNGNPVQMGCTLNHHWFSRVVGDSKGGAYVAWREMESWVPIDTGKQFICMNYIDAQGNWMWNGPYGIELDLVLRDATKPDRPFDILLEDLISDGQGGVIYCWIDSYNETHLDSGVTVRVQRINSAGEKIWGNKGKLVNIDHYPGRSSEFYAKRLISDGRGGALVANTQYAQRVDENGNSIWPGGGIYYGDFVRVNEVVVDIIRDELVLSGIMDLGPPYQLFQVRAVRYNLDGELVWQNILAEKVGTSSVKSKIAIADDGDAVIAWQTRNVYAQRVDSEGKSLWDNNGLAISQFPSSKGNVRLVPSDLNSMIFVWTDQRNDNTLGMPNLYAQKLDEAGTPLWNEDDILVSLIPSSYGSATSAIPDGKAGIIICWHATDGNLAQQINKEGQLGQVETNVNNKNKTASFYPYRYELWQNFPNPFNSETTIKYKIGVNEDNENKEKYKVNLTIYNSFGEEVIALVNEGQMSGEYQVQWNGKNSKGGDVASGVYIYQLIVALQGSYSIVETKKMLLVR